MQAQGEASASAGFRRGHRAAPVFHNAAGPRGNGSSGRDGQQELEERVHGALVSVSIGCMLAQRHAPRVYWNLAASAAMPRDAYTDVRLQPPPAGLSCA